LKPSPRRLVFTNIAGTLHEAASGAGYPRIFQISNAFGAAERGHKHLPEFTMLEWYAAGFDYHQFMDQCEALLIAAFKDRGRNQDVVWQIKR